MPSPHYLTRSATTERCTTLLTLPAPDFLRWQHPVLVSRCALSVGMQRGRLVRASPLLHPASRDSAAAQRWPEVGAPDEARPLNRPFCLWPWRFGIRAPGVLRLLGDHFSLDEPLGCGHGSSIPWRIAVLLAGSGTLAPPRRFPR